MLMRSLAIVVIAAVPAMGQRATHRDIVTWSGSVQSGAAAPVPVQYLITAVPSESRTFTILASGVAGPHRTTATGVAFDGISVRFRATFAADAHCKLDAVPARGYAGRCVYENGDTATLTLVPPVPGMLLPDHEVALARDAAPPHVAAGASVFVFGATGYVEVARGTNELTCFIQRPTPRDLWPICHTRAASRALVPVEQLRAVLRMSGLDSARVADSVAKAYRRGRFRPPASGAIGYMLSTYAWTVDPATESREFLAPHLHFYVPYGTNVHLGIDSTTHGVLPMRVEGEGKPDASVIVGVRVRKPT
jgi:hypothetical protein